MVLAFLLVLHQLSCSKCAEAAAVFALDELKRAFGLMLGKVLPLNSGATAWKGAPCQTARTLLNVSWKLELVESAATSMVGAHLRAVLALPFMLLFIHLAYLL